jgi:septal ring factor EnvC (AmiA/AmiB activator)
MKNTIALESLSKIAENYERNYKELNAAKQRVRILTRQRDEANARNAELRQQIAKYQKALAEERSKVKQPSAWDGAWQGGSRVHLLEPEAA